jgi:hypothetical protein
MSPIRSQITDTEIAGGGVGLVKIRNHPRDRKYAEASTIFYFLIFFANKADASRLVLITTTRLLSYPPESMRKTRV